MMFDILGQENVKKLFKNSFESGNIAHAFLLEGMDGLGKSIFAKYMAAALLRKSVPPCSDCDVCRRIEKGTHPDVIVFERKKSSIGIDAIRNMIEVVERRPYEGDRKVIIIKEGDYITLQGQNAMLKTLEEPPKDTFIIVTAQNLNMILPTIKSRCQIYKFNPIEIGKIKDYLIDSGHPQDESEVAAAFSEGIVGNALRFFEGGYQKLRKDVIDMVIKLNKGDELEALEFLDLLTKNQKNIGEVLGIMLNWYRDLMIIKFSKAQRGLINLDYLDVLLEESELLSYNKLNRIIDVVKKTDEKIRQYANFRLCMEVMLLNIQEV